MAIALQRMSRRPQESGSEEVLEDERHGKIE
jgi:hypothetical protein